MIDGNLTLMISAFGIVFSIVLMCALLLSGRKGRSDNSDRLGTSTNRSSALPRVGELMLPEDETKLSKLTLKLRHAGLYRRSSAAAFMGVKFLLLISPMPLAFLLVSLGIIEFTAGVLLGASLGLFGTLLCSLWLSHRKADRQKQVRRALPDALDVIVICIEGGLSLPAAFARVAAELKGAHPLLAAEMSIVRREIQLGRTTGEALRQFANRFDSTELRSLASVVVQAERFGASVAKGLRVHADSLRLKRYQHAESQAQKAPVKLIFPTVLCIFPALYIVLMGPAGVQLLEMFEDF